MATLKNKFIDDASLSETVSLTHLLEKYETNDDVEEVHVIKHSPFYSKTKFANLLKSKAGLCIVNCNIQNIYSKFDEFKSLIDRVNITNPISAICLNECWINEHSDVSTIQLPNYKLYCQRG